MTTHPPGQPDGPTGPGRVDDLDAELNRHHLGIGEPNEFSTPPAPLLGTAEDCDCGHGDLDRMFHLRPCPRLGPPVPALPRLGEVLRDAERLIRCALTVLERPVDPASYPQAAHGHVADARFEVAGFHLEAAMRELGGIAALPLPAVGSAIKLPVAAGKEPTPGSASATPPEAVGESIGGRQLLGAGTSPDPSPGSAAPVSPPGRGVGPGVLGPTEGQVAFAKAVTDAMEREAARRRPR